MLKVLAANDLLRCTTRKLISQKTSIPGKYTIMSKREWLVHFLPYRESSSRMQCQCKGTRPETLSRMWIPGLFRTLPQHSRCGRGRGGVRILWNLIIVMSLAKDAMLFRFVVALHNNVCNFVRPSGQVYLPTADSTEKGSSISSHGQILNSMTIQFHCLPGTFLKGIFPLLLFLWLVLLLPPTTALRENATQE